MKDIIAVFAGSDPSWVIGYSVGPIFVGWSIRTSIDWESGDAHIPLADLGFRGQPIALYSEREDPLLHRRPRLYQIKEALLIMQVPCEVLQITDCSATNHITPYIS